MEQSYEQRTNSFVEIKAGDIILFYYTNYRGETSSRKAIVKQLFWGSNGFHKESQAFLHALDLDKMVYRDFALKDMKSVMVVESTSQWDYEE